MFFWSTEKLAKISSMRKFHVLQIVQGTERLSIVCFISFLFPIIIGLNKDEETRCSRSEYSLIGVKQFTYSSVASVSATGRAPFQNSRASYSYLVRWPVRTRVVGICVSSAVGGVWSPRGTPIPQSLVLHPLKVQQVLKYLHGPSHVKEISFTCSLVIN